MVVMIRLQRDTGPIAFLFPGQGSQFIGMGRDLYENLEHVRNRLDQASAFINRDLRSILFHGDTTELTRTEIAQIAVFTLSTAIAEFLQGKGIQPSAVAGHSLGEYSALVVAGALSWEEALEFVWQRGLAMAEASARSRQAMVAIAGLAPERVEELCIQVRDFGPAVVANQNSPLQLVVSGDEEALLRLMDLARQSGMVRVDRLSVAGAFHSPLMASAEAALTDRLATMELRPPTISVVSSIDGTPITDLTTYRQILAKQITCPVRWVDTVTALKSLNIRRCLEVGPGRVLTGLTRQCDRSLQVESVGDFAAVQQLLDRFQATLLEVE